MKIRYGSTTPSSEETLPIMQAASVTIKARLKIVSRSIDHEVAGWRVTDPFLPSQLNDAFIERFRKWSQTDLLIALKQDRQGNWIEVPIRQRSLATAEEAVIQLKAALNHR